MGGLTSKVPNFSELSKGINNQTEDNLQDDNNDGNEEYKIKDCSENVNILVVIIARVEECFSVTTT